MTRARTGSGHHNTTPYRLFELVLVSPHPVAPAADVEHGGVVEKAIDDGGGDDRVSEDLPSPKPRLEVKITEPFS